MAGPDNHERPQQQGDSEDLRPAAASSRDAGSSLERQELQGCTQLEQNWLELQELQELEVVLEAVEEEEEVGPMLDL